MITLESLLSLLQRLPGLRSGWMGKAGDDGICEGREGGVCVGHSVRSDSLRPLDYSLPGSSVHQDSPGKNTGVGCHLPSELPGKPRKDRGLSLLASVSKKANETETGQQWEGTGIGMGKGTKPGSPPWIEPGCLGEVRSQKRKLCSNSQKDKQ